MRCSKKIQNGELLELIAWGRAELLRSGIEEAQEECERILMKLLGCSRPELYLKGFEGDLADVREGLLRILEKRARRIPLAYLLKEADFWHETLFVDERCLIPRPETEILVERALKALGRDTGKIFSFLDIGTGSGAIAIAILRTFKNAQGTLLDISGEALEVARINIEKYGLQDRATLVRGDIFSLHERDSGLGTRNEDPAPGASPEGRVPAFNLIVSNPPYLSEVDWEGVQEELKFEPRRALDGGKDGLDLYRKIITGAKDHLTPGGLLAFEVGRGQSEMVSTWLQTAGYDNIQRFKDHLGIERVVIARKGEI
jgi:release factor glutamine methyltransferase